MNRDMKRNFWSSEISIIIGLLIFFSAHQLFADEVEHEEDFRAPRFHHGSLGTWEARMFYKLQTLKDNHENEDLDDDFEDEDLQPPTIHDALSPKEAVKMTDKIQNALDKLKSPACPEAAQIITRPRNNTLKKDKDKKDFASIAIAKIEPLFNKLGAVLDSLNKTAPFDDDEQKRRKNAIRKLKDRNLEIIKFIKKIDAIKPKDQDDKNINHKKDNEESNLFLQMEKMNQMIYSSLTLYAESKIFQDKNLGASENLTKQLDTHYMDLLSAKIAHVESLKKTIDTDSYEAGIKFLHHIYQSNPLFVSVRDNSLQSKISELNVSLKKIDNDTNKLRENLEGLSKLKPKREDADQRKEVVKQLKKDILEQEQKIKDLERKIKPFEETRKFINEFESYVPAKEENIPTKDKK